MKIRILVLGIGLMFNTAVSAFSTSSGINDNPSPSIPELITELEVEINLIEKIYISKEAILQKSLATLNENLIAKNISLEQKVDILIEKENTKEVLYQLKLSNASEISKVRYIKGLQIIKILFEKVLALDHHFSTVSTFSEINKISNPNNYSEFLKVKDFINKNKNKKTGFNLTNILGQNMFASVTHSLISLFNTTNATRDEKEANLKEIECILDFTLRMHNDLNTIYFETAFLQKSNTNVMSDLQQLFTDFTKPINYRTPLKDCRETDDWDNVREHLEDYLTQLDKYLKDSGSRFKAHKMQINLEFPIDRLLRFITEYNAFIDQGAKFYEKFGIMLNSYENAEQCSTNIPAEYNKLKQNITLAIEKFNTAYKPVEINGSKMKEVLYGINEYD